MLIWTSRNIPNVGLFSAYAEVFPMAERMVLLAIAFLCLRRGVSSPLRFSGKEVCFSLPTQRCFLKAPLVQRCFFPFLCLRRGVSNRLAYGLNVAVFSLPTQRCFPPAGMEPPVFGLFSAYAEVFLIQCSRVACLWPFLCLRRGVSRYLASVLWRTSLFSAYAEVFL